MVDAPERLLRDCPALLCLLKARRCCNSLTPETREESVSRVSTFLHFEASAVRFIFTFLTLLLWSPSPHSKASTNKSIFKSKLVDGCPPSKHGINPSPQSKALSALYYSSITACSCKTASSCTKRASHLWLRFFPPTSSSSSSFVLLLSRPVWIFATNFLLWRTWKKPSTIF